jgi:hypothetical protein
LSDSPGSPQNNPDSPVINEKEKELLLRIKEMGTEVAEDAGVGLITPESMPNAYFNVLCYFIAYKTGTSLKHIMDMSLFDFISYMYIIRELASEQSDNPNNPEERELMNTIGG